MRTVHYTDSVAGEFSSRRGTRPGSRTRLTCAPTDGSSPTTASRCRKRLASEVRVPIVGDHHVVLDANAAELAELIHLRPVDMFGAVAGFEVFQQPGDEIQPRLDSERHARLDDAREAEELVPLGLGDQVAQAIGMETGNVVDL